MLKRAIAESPVLGVLRLEAGERWVCLLLTAYFFLALTSVSLVKSLQNGIYLGNLGFDAQLPLLYLALAILSGPLVFLFRFLSNRVPLIWITSATLAMLGVGLFWFWLRREGAGPWGFAAFYIWGSIFSVLVPTQGWITSYHLFTPRTAKRSFSILGTGGVLGGLAGGIYTAVAARHFSSQTLLLQVLALLVVLQLLLVVVFRERRQSHPGPGVEGHTPPAQAGRKAVHTVLHSRHLSYLAALVLFTGCASTLIDLHFKWSLTTEFTRSEAQITQFFGALQGAIFLISALIQLLLTNQVLRKFGLGVGLAFLPVGLSIGAFGMVLTSAFWAVVGVKMIDCSARSSIEQTSLELLYVPLSGRQNVSIKSFMELVILRLGDGFGAAIFLILGALALNPSLEVGLVLIVLGAGWFLVTRRLSEEYSCMLRRSLENVGTRLARQGFPLDEAVAEKALVGALKSSNRNKVLFALQQLQSKDLESGYGELSSHSLSGEYVTIDASDFQRTRREKGRWLTAVEALVDHSDPQVAALALHLVLTGNVGGYRESLDRQLRSPRIPRPRDLRYLSEYAPDPSEFLVPKYVFQWCIDANPRQSVRLAYLIGAMKNPLYLQILRSWLESPDRALCKAALKALSAFQDRQDIPRIAPFLAPYWSREVARKALAQFGEEAVTFAFEQLRDSRVDVAIKRELPSVLAQINTSSARGTLVASLYTHDAVVAYRAVLALNRIKGLRDLSYSQESFEPLLQIWAKEYYGLLNVKALLVKEQTAAADLLRKVLTERLKWGIEKVFRGLDLILPRGDAYFSYLGYTSARMELKENAIELIDSRIRGELRHTLLPIFAEMNEFDVLQRGREIFQLPTRLDAVLSEAFFDGDPWLKCCALATIQMERMESLRDLVRQACEDIHPLVRETAEWALREWERPSPDC